MGRRIDAIDHQGVYGEIVAEIDGRSVTLVPGVDATTCGLCGAVITRGRLATAAALAAHRCEHEDCTRNVL